MHGLLLLALIADPGAPPRDLGTFNVSAYCSCTRCCGKSDGITASGQAARWGVVAADWRVLPKGSRLSIEGFPGETFTVLDKGGAIKGRRLDIWFPSHQAALDFGRRQLRIRTAGEGKEKS